MTPEIGDAILRFFWTDALWFLGAVALVGGALCLGAWWERR